MTEERVHRRLAAILAADVAGYSRLMGEDEEATLAALTAHLGELFEPAVAEHEGRVVKTTGDGLLAEFASVVDAVRCAAAVQEGMAARNAGVAKGQRIDFRIGVHLGDVIVQDGDVFGDGVNVAARLEGIAEPGGICISAAVHEHLDGRLAAGFEDAGEQSLKNIARPVHIWRSRVAPDDEGVTDLSAPVPGFGGRPAIAVLPFDNLSGDPEQEHFADGIAEDLLTRLAMWRWLPVIARNSSFAYKGRSVDVREVGRALGARYVLEGSVRTAGRRLRLTGQLIDAETGHHVWAERYDRELDDIFAVQDEITDAIVSALEPVVGEAEMRRARLKPAASLDAWELYQRGLWHLEKLTKEGLAEAMPLLRRAAEKDPGFAQPLAAMAEGYVIEVLFIWADQPAAALAEADRLARSAAELDPADPSAHAALGYVALFMRRHDDAVAEARQAVELNPSFAMGWHCLCVALMMDGRPRESAEAMERAVRISPHDALLPLRLGALSLAYYMDGDYERAVETARLAVRHGPRHPLGHRHLAAALGQLGWIDEAREALAAFVALTPNYTRETARQATPFRDDADFERFVDGLRKAGWDG